MCIRMRFNLSLHLGMYMCISTEGFFGVCVCVCVCVCVGTSEDTFALGYSIVIEIKSFHIVLP